MRKVVTPDAASFSGFEACELAAKPPNTVRFENRPEVRLKVINLSGQKSRTRFVHENQE